MTLMSPLRLTLATLLISAATSAFADDDTVLLRQPFSILSTNGVVTAITPDPTPIEKQLLEFTFNWNDHATIAQNKQKIAEEEAFLKTLRDIPQLTASDQRTLGLLLYTLGTYYTHIAREPDLAITRLTLANTLLANPDEKAWNDNHLAYAYAQKFAANHDETDKEKALYYTNAVISEIFPNTKNNAVAFAYSTKGLIQNNTNEYDKAIASFKTALAIYDALPDEKDDQYMRTKTRLANALINQPGHEQEAINLLKEVKNYWQEKGNLTDDPYAARNLLSLGQAYLKVGKAKAANTELQQAVAIYKNFYGNKSALLVKPYQMLAETHKKLGHTNQATAYEQKANAISNA